MEVSTVEQLMKDILGGMKKLASSQIFRSVLQNDMETLEEALEEAIRYILKVEPSLPDLEFNNDERIFTSEQDATGVILQQNGETMGFGDPYFPNFESPENDTSVNITVQEDGGAYELITKDSYHGITLLLTKEYLPGSYDDDRLE
ncbi:hypothetical protein COCCADRAFT_31299 [Bipolaris zeicola 26-R-13]|uniref:Uncharacterized protein n=1 Tax=Cochliobolus carbonum (strain 26-R-13) TaxID=930089 RepID=W6Y735_COCC2|nr:uncharacterized protein COCCADRAFT_31299 [Bipolaris zeicola 26-R-13]EUC27136.1 hypothetical protein COCCADRAFT_31299 [Bipolaris zeicola 26-R-13]